MTTIGAKGLVAGRGKSDGGNVGKSRKLREGENGQRGQGTAMTGLVRSEVCLDHQCLVASPTWTAFVYPSIHSFI